MPGYIDCCTSVSTQLGVLCEKLYSKSRTVCKMSRKWVWFCVQRVGSAPESQYASGCNTTNSNLTNQHQLQTCTLTKFIICMHLSSENGILCLREGNRISLLPWLMIVKCVLFAIYAFWAHLKLDSLRWIDFRLNVQSTIEECSLNRTPLYIYNY